MNCPKCGSEMDVDERWESFGERDYTVDIFVCKCGYEEKVKDGGA